MGTPGQKNKMEEIWEKLPKNKDGYTITYLKNDPVYLYHNGFVDTQAFTLEDWLAAFKPFDQDGKFVLDREQFLTLEKYRFKTGAQPSFDAMKLREGPWPDVELAYLWQTTLKHNTTVSFDVFERAVEALKKDGHVDKDGFLLVDESVKKQLKFFLDRFPSPRRKLEKEVDRIRKKRGDTMAANTKNREASNFVVGQTQLETQQDKLKSLESSADEGPGDLHTDESESIDIKSFKKPKGKFRG